MNKKTYFVVFKAGYEVQASTVEEARELARKELMREVYEDGLKRFVCDVEG